MINAKLWINIEWSEPFNIISITPVVKYKLFKNKYGVKLEETVEIHVIYIDKYGELDLFKCSDSLTSIKIIK